MTKVKICGITNLEDALQSVKWGAEALGFNFYGKSPRYVTPESARSIIEKLPDGISKVGVFVNQSPTDIRAIVEATGLTAVQLHGDETPQDVCEVRNLTRCEVIKAFRVSPDFDPKDVTRYEADAVLLDGFSASERGGTGTSFDWEIAVQIQKQFSKVYLAGGLSPDNVAAAATIVEPFAVDACSSIENLPGKKDHFELRRFIESSRKPVKVSIYKVPSEVLQSIEEGEMPSEFVADFVFQTSDSRSLQVTSSTANKLNAPIELMATYDVGNHSLSVFMKYGNEHIFSAAVQWKFIQPHFMVNVPSEGQFDLFFDK